MKTSIIYGEYVGKADASAQCYPSKWRVKMSGDYSLKTGGIPFYKKYYDPTFNNSVGNADLYVMRFAEVYLIAAEATAWLHGLSANRHGKTAVDYVNEILARVRKGLINAYPFDELTYNPFLDVNRHDPLTGQNPVEVYWQ